MYSIPYHGYSSGGQHGTPDMYRDIRGFPIKFYTEEVCNFFMDF